MVGVVNGCWMIRSLKSKTYICVCKCDEIASINTRAYVTQPQSMQHRMTDVIISDTPAPSHQDTDLHTKLQSTNMYHARRLRDYSYYHPYMTKHRRDQQAALRCRAWCLTVLCLLLVLALLWFVVQSRPDAGGDQEGWGGDE